MKFTHNNKHSIGNHYEPLIKQQLGNPKMKPNEVKIKSEEETSNQKQKKYQQVYQKMQVMYMKQVYMMIQVW